MEIVLRLILWSMEYGRRVIVACLWAVFILAMFGAMMS